MTLKELIAGLEAELAEVIAQDKADAELLSDEEVQYNEGWAGGMSRAILLLKAMEGSLDLLTEINNLSE
jgi:hypothetical protein